MTEVSCLGVHQRWLLSSPFWKSIPDDGGLHIGIWGPSVAPSIKSNKGKALATLVRIPGTQVRVDSRPPVITSGIINESGCESGVIISLRPVRHIHMKVRKRNGNAHLASWQHILGWTSSSSGCRGWTQATSTLKHHPGRCLALGQSWLPESPVTKSVAMTAESEQVKLNSGSVRSESLPSRVFWVAFNYKAVLCCRSLKFEVARCH